MAMDGQFGGKLEAGIHGCPIYLCTMCLRIFVNILLWKNLNTTETKYTALKVRKVFCYPMSVMYTFLILPKYF